MRLTLYFWWLNLSDNQKLGKNGSNHSCCSENSVCQSLELLLFDNSSFDEFLPALNHLGYQGSKPRAPLRDKNRLINDPQWVLIFLSRCCWMFPEQLRNQNEFAGWEKNSSSLDKALKIRDSVRLISSESFSVTLASISSETLDMNSWAIPGPSVFCDWVLFVFSGDSFGISTNFFRLFNVAMILREKFCQLWPLIFFSNFRKKMLLSSY